jgi:hypothetical protein
VNYLPSLVLVASVASAQAGILPNNLKIFPAQVQRGTPFVLVVDDSWPTCIGTVRTTVTSTRIDVVADGTTQPGVGCTAEIKPFKQVINPRLLLPTTIDFANSVEVRYTKRDDNGSRTEIDTVSFAASSSATVELESGSFTSANLPVAGLFLDQQDKVLTVTLNDYDDQGRGSWFYGAGSMNGNVFTGQLSSFVVTGVCVRTPCPRAVAARTTDVSLVIVDQQTALVSLGGNLSPTLANKTFEYERFEFVASTLPPASRVGFELPELLGNWIGGTVASGSRRAALAEVSIRYRGADAVRGLADYYFDALPVPATSTSRPLFTIRCADDRPVDGEIGCALENYEPAPGVQCEAYFSPGEVGPNALSVPVGCSNGVETRFLLRRQ